MKRAAVLGLLALTGCGAGGGPLERVSAEPPDGAQAAGKRAERQGSNDPAAGEAIYKLRPREGERLRYTVTLRNPTTELVSVTGVAADGDRDGAFVPERVDGTPVRVEPGASAPVAVEGRVRGCRYGGQMVSLAGPELELTTGGNSTTQQLDLGIQVEMVVQGCS